MYRYTLTGLLALTLLAGAAASQSLPTGFTNEVVVTGISQPVGMGFAPDGRFFVTARTSAQVWVCLKTGAKQLMGTVPSVTTGSERGLLGICVDPNFPTSPYIYVHYSRVGGMAVSRYTVTGPDLNNPNGTNLSLGARYDILTGLPDVAFNHNGGTVRFGTDGMLYASFGDDDGSHCAPSATVGNGRGEIFRMDVSGLPAGAGGPPPIASIVAPGNPTSWGGQPTGPWAALVWAQGFRNPFRFNVDDVGPNATGNLYVADVGEVSWEELDEIPAGTGGLHFGSPWWEGNATWMSCPGVPVPPSPVFPIATLSHAGTGAGSIMSMPRYRNVPGGAFNFGSAYEGDIFYADYYNGRIYRVTWNGSSWVTAPPAPGQPSGSWGTGFGGLSDAVIGPDDGAIYYCAHTAGQIRRIRSDANAPHVNIVSGDGQVGNQGQPLEDPLVVQVVTQGVPQAGVTVTWTASTGTLSAASTVTDANGFTQVDYTLDPAIGSDPVITASVTNGVPATFGAVWRGLTFNYIGGANLAIVNFRHSQPSSPITIGFDVPHPNPLLGLPWGDIWLDFFTPSPSFGVLVDGMGLFGPPTPGAVTTGTNTWSQIYTGLPSLGGLTLAFQGYAVDTSLLPDGTAIVISDKVVITFN